MNCRPETNIKKCIVTKNVDSKGERPVLMLADGTQATADTPTAEKAESA